MKTIQRQLPLTDTYSVISISRHGIESGNACCCDNCGKVIINTASIQNKAGERFTVGLDCVKTLTKSISNPVMLDDTLYDFNMATRFMTLYNKATKIEDDGFQIFVTYTDTKGKSKEACIFKYLLTDFGFISK